MSFQWIPKLGLNPDTVDQNVETEWFRGQAGIDSCSGTSLRGGSRYVLWCEFGAWVPPLGLSRAAPRLLYPLNPRLGRCATESPECHPGGGSNLGTNLPAKFAILVCRCLHIHSHSCMSMHTHTDGRTQTRCTYTCVMRSSSPFQVIHPCAHPCLICLVCSEEGS